MPAFPGFPPPSSICQKLNWSDWAVQTAATAEAAADLVTNPERRRYKGFIYFHFSPLPIPLSLFYFSPQSSPIETELAGCIKRYSDQHSM